MLRKIFNQLTEAISKDERKVYTDYAKILKTAVKKEAGMSGARVMVGKSQRANPFIRVVNRPTVPNDYRKKVMGIVYPNETPSSGNDNINFGNIGTYGVDLKYTDWVKIYPDTNKA